MTRTHTTFDRTAPFPVDWTLWRDVWDGWLTAQVESGTLRRSSYRFPEPNFLAEEVLGVWSVQGRATVELSEVTFPDLSSPRSGYGRPETARYVGVTFGQGSGIESGGIASTLEELERALGL